MEKKNFKMDEALNEKNVMANFEVEELEKRYEMGWIKGGSVSVGVTYGPNGPSYNFGGCITI